VAALSDAQIDKTISALLNASGPEEARRLLRASPWLTSKEVYRKLTEMIADKRRERDLLGMTCLVACRGFLCRCRSWKKMDKALAAQPGWPLYNQGPLNQLLALPGIASADERIQWANVALADVDPKEEPDFYGLVNYHLGWGYQIKADAGSNEALAQAITHFELAEAAWQGEDSLFGNRFLGRAQDYLGRLYMQRRHGDRSQDIETALGWFEKAHTTFGREAPEQLDMFMLMAKAYLNRIRGERFHNIEQGIEYYRKAYQLAKQEKLEQHLGYIEHSLAVAYRLRLRGDPADNYERARKWAEKALKRFDRQKFPKDWARTAGELATIYAHRQYGDRNRNLEKAIEHAEQTLAVYEPQDHPHQWTLAQLTLGNLYCDRISGVRTKNYCQAIRYFKAILDRCDQDSDPLMWAEALNSLGTVYASRSTRPSDANYHRATDCFRQASVVRKPKALPPQARQTAANWGNLAFRFGKWTEAWEAFQVALDANNALYQVGSTEAGRRAELAEGAGLATKAAFCLLNLDRPRPAEAVEVLERGRTRIVGDILARDRAALEGVNPTDRRDFEAARQRVRELEAEGRLADSEAGRSFLEISTDLSAAHAKLAQIIERIRATVPGFMPAGLDVAAIRATARPDRPLVYVLTTEHCSAAIIVPYRRPEDDQSRAEELEELDEQHLVWLRDFRSAELDDLLVTHDEDGNLTGGLLLGQLMARELEAELDVAWPTIRQQLMAPLVKRLQELGYATASLVPIGQLSLLPLHATVLDELTFSFAPSAQVLGQVQNTDVLDLPVDQLVLSGVGNPLPNGSPLPFAKSELQEIVELWPGLSQPLYEEQAALSEAKARLPEAGVCHFACHGRFDLDDPLASGLHMGDGLLSLTDLLDKDEVNLEKTRLAVLSACQTAITDFRDVPDEAIGLPAGFLVAGVPGVVGSLWPVYDVSTALLMTHFYRKWLEDDTKPTGLPEALRQAQIWLRDVTAGELAGYFRNKRRAILKGEHASWSPRHVSQLFNRFNDLPAKKRPFDHPVYWAAFTYTGV